jgi:hypothetical protein
MSYLYFPFYEIAETLLDFYVYIQSTVHLSVTHQQIDCPPSPQRLAADYSQPQSDNFGNFRRLLAFELATTFFLAYMPTVTRNDQSQCLRLQQR